jgi:hypothetical protein
VVFTGIKWANFVSQSTMSIVICSKISIAEFARSRASIAGCLLLCVFLLLFCFVAFTDSCPDALGAIGPVSLVISFFCLLSL